MVCCNLDDSTLPKNQRITDYIQKSAVININNKKIGIIGYVTPKTKYSSRPGDIKFLDEVESIKQEAEKLKRQGINIIIALDILGSKKTKKLPKMFLMLM